LRYFYRTVVQKQHKISSWGLGSWDPAAKEHMMAYNMQLKDFTTMSTRKQSSSRAWGSRSSWSYGNYESESGLHFGNQINRAD